MHQIIAEHIDQKTGTVSGQKGWQARYARCYSGLGEIGSVRMKTTFGQVTVCMIGAGGSSTIDEYNHIRVYENGALRESLTYKDGKLLHVWHQPRPSLWRRLLTRHPV
jgi:hypothetical protein